MEVGITQLGAGFKFRFGFGLISILLQVLIAVSQNIHHKLQPPSNLDVIDPTALGLSRSDLETILRNVKLLPIKDAIGSGLGKSQVLNVGFNENEHLPDFSTHFSDGLADSDKAVAEMAFKQLKQYFKSPNAGMAIESTPSTRNITYTAQQVRSQSDGANIQMNALPYGLSPEHLQEYARVIQEIQSIAPTPTSIYSGPEETQIVTGQNIRNHYNGDSLPHVQQKKTEPELEHHFQPQNNPVNVKNLHEPLNPQLQPHHNQHFLQQQQQYQYILTPILPVQVQTTQYVPQPQPYTEYQNNYLNNQAHKLIQFQQPELAPIINNPNQHNQAQNPHYLYTPQQFHLTQPPHTYYPGLGQTGQIFSPQHYTAQAQLGNAQRNPNHQQSHYVKPTLIQITTPQPSIFQVTPSIDLIPIATVQNVVNDYNRLHQPMQVLMQTQSIPSRANPIPIQNSPQNQEQPKPVPVSLPVQVLEIQQDKDLDQSPQSQQKKPKAVNPNPTPILIHHKPQDSKRPSAIKNEPRPYFGARIRQQHEFHPAHYIHSPLGILPRLKTIASIVMSAFAPKVYFNDHHNHNRPSQQQHQNQEQLHSSQLQKRHYPQLQQQQQHPPFFRHSPNPNPPPWTIGDSNSIMEHHQYTLSNRPNDSNEPNQENARPSHSHSVQSQLSQPQKVSSQALAQSPAAL